MLQKLKSRRSHGGEEEMVFIHFKEKGDNRANDNLSKRGNTNMRKRLSTQHRLKY